MPAPIGGGVAFAALILLGYRIWPEILIAAFLICESASTPLKASIAISIGETVSVLAGAYLIPPFKRYEEILEIL